MFRENEDNPMWKGEGVGLYALHVWVKNRKPKPLHCEMCKSAQPVDLANISQQYKRDVDDFEWLCRRCHMTKDGRLKKLLEFKKIPKPPRLPEMCVSCNKIKHTVAKHYCSTCYRKLRYVEKKCIECGEIFLSDGRPHHKRCSRKCLSNSVEYKKLRSEIAKKRTGQKNSNWRHGKYSTNYRSGQNT